jgi:fluoride exporter
VTMGIWFGVGLIGGIGAVSRFAVDSGVQRANPSGLPLGTLVVNVSGAFVLGLLTGLSVTGDALLLAGTALIGSFTTFSTWMLETQRLAEDGEVIDALVNIGLSIAAGLCAAGAGWAIGAAL